MRSENKTSSTSAVAHVNRRGDIYFLHRKTAASGKCRYTFARVPGSAGELLSTLPSGYEIVESVHGRVTLRRRRPSPIPDIEVAAVRSVLRRNSHLQGCRIQVQPNVLLVYEPRSARIAEPPSARLPGFGPRPVPERSIEYEEVIRFRFLDKSTRTYTIDRMCYRSWVDGWLALGRTGSIGELARLYLPFVATEMFYELWPSVDPAEL